ncbi:MAG: RsmB/NOP family class I SAM-dependent RNA methyltransferase [Myxococcaceae bacterium]
MPPLSTTFARIKSIPWWALRASVGELDAAVAEVLTGRAAERVLDRYLRAHKGFSPEERQASAEAIFGVGLWRRRLAYQAGTDAPRALLFCLLRDLAGLQVGDIAEWLAISDAPPVKPAPTGFADFFSLPDWLAEALTRELGDDAPAFCDAISRPGPVCLRANTLKTSREVLIQELGGRSGLLAKHSVILDSRGNLLGSKAHRLGHFEAQDEGSQLLAEMAAARPGDRVLDLCAGAGGKSLALAAEMENQGELFVYDVDGERLDRLLQRASRAGVSCVRVLREVPSGLEVDRVLVDAPCSELGVLRRGPDLRFRLDPTSFSTLPALQLELLTRGAGCVRPGGRLVYATCTLRREENEEVALAFEHSHPQFRRAGNGFFRVLPHTHDTDGFFAAVYERVGAMKSR